MTYDFPEIKEIDKRLTAIEELLVQTIAIGGGKTTWTVSDVARVEGISAPQIRTTEKYLLPRFGQSAFPDGTTRWPIEECLAWRKIPPEERKRAYEEHCRQMRRDYISRENQKAVRACGGR